MLPAVEAHGLLDGHLAALGFDVSRIELIVLLAMGAGYATWLWRGAEEVAATLRGVSVFCPSFLMGSVTSVPIF